MSTQEQVRILRVGIIGCGEITQVAHIPNINFLSHRFQTTYLCDISQQALQHCSKKVQGGTPKTTTGASELCASPDVDVVVIANADAYHVEHGILALKNDKFCLVEKPASVCFRDLDLLVEAEKRSKGKVMVGTMRRFAIAFTDAVEEVGGMQKIQYARVRDIIGPNATFVDQSGTFPQKFSDYSDADTQDRLKREEDIFEQALAKEFGVPVTSESKLMLRLLGGLGTHDLSAMREIIGMPQSVAGAVLSFPSIFSVLFKYDDFPVTYESGIIGVPEFDAHIEVYSANKIVRVNFDTPYVKGLPVTMTVKERIGADGFQERTIRKTYQDPYTTEFLELYDCVVGGKAPKTSAADARNDIELFKMILQADAGRFRGGN
ncbi:oxidoreductase [Colletotrichum sojae]|uniref:Oxidoreductase n=1 Tax=Colletotrichum sojae TaxID=2175907 RepID=A0A8H6J870_9PEZI|nr:oxidoreductase [Colletotrichum sojae]